MKRFAWIILAVMVSCSILGIPGCNFFQEVFKEHEFKTIELRENPSSQYYDAVVRVEHLQYGSQALDRFKVKTLSNVFKMEDLTFIEEGKKRSYLEAGDIFVVPLNKLEWELVIDWEDEDGETRPFFVDCWELLPEEDRWHPLKSEAMEVAQSIELSQVDGILQPVPKFLPDEWELGWEECPDGRCGTLQYQKVRVGEVKEEVNIEYCKLTDEERRELGTTSETEFLSHWTAWTEKFSRPGVVAGHTAVYWDMRGFGSYGWSYRYAYVDDDMVVEVTLDSDPLEWVKTEQEKEEERRTRRIFVTYGYGPIGEPEWMITIEIRLNGEGSFYKQSQTGISIERLFRLTQGELDEIERALQENKFLELELYSGTPSDINSFITVEYDDMSHTVVATNAATEPYRNIEQKIREIVLPKVGETP